MQFRLSVLSVSASISLCLSGPFEDLKAQPNVLFIGVDDLRPELGAYGSRLAITPHLNKLAEDSVVFKRAYVQQAVCSASRASFLTGLRPDTTGADYPYSEYFVNEVLPKHPSLSRFFFSKGYFTRNLGKVHHGLQEHLSEREYQPPIIPHYQLPENIEAGKAYQNGRGPTTPAYEAADLPDANYKDGKVAREVIATLKGYCNSDKEAPFFLAVGFYKPHLPFVAPKRYFDLYDPNTIELPENYQLDTSQHAVSTAHYALKKYKGPATDTRKQLPEHYARELIHAYLACVSFVDAQIGLILESLEELGLSSNTIVVFWSDHGWHLGEQGMWGKTTNFENATRAPLIIKVPHSESSGSHSQALVEYVDLYPTLLELTGHEIPNYLEGTSLVPLLKEPNRSWKSAAFSQFPRGNSVEGYAIRTDRYRYVAWYRKNPVTGERGVLAHRELYDHQTDPLESINLADHQNYAAIEETLSAQLHAGWKAALPAGVSNDAKNPVAPVAVKYKK